MILYNTTLRECGDTYYTNYVTNLTSIAINSEICIIEKDSGIKIEKALITSNIHEDGFTKAINRYRLDHIVLYKFQINQEVVDNCHSLGVHVYAYTCNTLGLYYYMEGLGCDGIITDSPGGFIL